MFNSRINAIPVLTGVEDAQPGLIRTALENLDRYPGPFEGQPLTPAATQSFLRPNRNFVGARWVQLPPPAPLPLRLEEAFLRRHSCRDYSGEPLGLNHIAMILGWGVGLLPEGLSESQRPFPTPGGLYGVETYLLARAVKGLQPGAYHYACQGHGLNQISRRDRLDLGTFILGIPGKPNFLDQAAALIVLASSAGKAVYKYGPERSWKLLLLEAGHMAQNLALVAGAIPNVGHCCLGGFAFHALNDELCLDGDHEISLYPILLGTRSRQPD